MNDANLQIFCAALQGITANPAFFGPLMQQSPDEAVRFARRCVRAAYDYDDARGEPNLTSASGTDGHDFIFGPEPEATK